MHGDLAGAAPAAFPRNLRRRSYKDGSEVRPKGDELAQTAGSNITNILFGTTVLLARSMAKGESAWPDSASMMRSKPVSTNPIV